MMLTPESGVCVVLKGRAASFASVPSQVYAPPPPDLEGLVPLQNSVT